MLLLFGAACGDSVVVARGVSLVSAAQSSDAGLGDAEADDEADDAHHLGRGGEGGSSNHHSSAVPVSNHSTGDKGGRGGAGGTSDSKHH